MSTRIRLNAGLLLLSAASGCGGTVETSDPGDATVDQLPGCSVQPGPVEVACAGSTCRAPSAECCEQGAPTRPITFSCASNCDEVPNLISKYTCDDVTDCPQGKICCMDTSAGTSDCVSVTEDGGACPITAGKVGHRYIQTCHDVCECVPSALTQCIPSTVDAGVNHFDHGPLDGGVCCLVHGAPCVTPNGAHMCCDGECISDSDASPAISSPGHCR
jgi:hypothetical protein